MRPTPKPPGPAPEPGPPKQEACWIVHDPGEHWLAGRTQRALAARGIVGVEIPLAVLPIRLAGTRRVWLLRAGALPARLPALPASRAAPSLYVGVEVAASGEPTPGWQALIDAGGRLAANATLPRWVAVHVDSPEVLVDALGRTSSMEQALVLAAETQRAVVASGIRAQWSAQVRVGLLIGTLHRGGAERIALDLAEHLPRLGVATRLVACFAPKRESFTPPRDATLLYERAAPDADLAALAADDFSRWGADIVHAHLMDARVLRRLASLGHGIVTTAHNARAGWPAGLGALSTREAELVIGCSLATTRELHAAGVSAPIRTAWNGVARLPAPAPDARARLRAALGIASDALVLVSVANDRPQKRLHRLGPILEALAQRGIDAHAVQVGSRPDARLPETIAAGAASVPGHPRLHFVGAQERVADWLGAADVFVATSAHEGLSLSQLEALGAGLPVVATITGGHDELAHFAPGYAGLPQDASADDFAVAIAAAVGAAASVRPVAVERLSIARMAARHAQLYRNVVAARHARGRGLLVVSNNYATGGAQASARRFALATHARGVRCGVGVLFETDEALSDASRALRAAGVPLWAPTGAQRTGPRALAEAAVSFVRAFDPAVVMFWNANVEVKLRIADALLNLPVFDVSPGEMYFAELERYVAKPAADLPCLSQRDYGALLAGVIVKYGGEAARAAQVLGRPVSVVPNGLPVPAAPEHDLAHRGRTIGTLARINPDKKLEQLLAAFAIASARDPALELLIGGAPDKGHVAYAEKLRHDSAHLRVRWLGQLRPDELFARIALFALVAEPAGCPNASLEAMAAGLPVLATNVGGMAEQVVPGETGWLVARGDVDALAIGMADAFSNPATLTSFGLRAHARARRLFSVDRMVDDYLRVTGLAPAGAGSATKGTDDGL